MPDDIRPDDHGLAGDPGYEGEPTQAVPASEATGTPAAGDATRAIPAGDRTQAMAAGDATRAIPAGDRTQGPRRDTGMVPAGPRTPPQGRRRWSNRTWLIVLASVAVLLAGAGIALAVTGNNSGGTNTGGSGGSGAANIPASTAPDGPPCPLTGVPTSGTQVSQRPALAVKVDNYPQARPQSGLDQADIVYEEPVEGGITRLVAVFQCQSPSLVGPIRSARAVDVQILDELSKPLFVHAGGIAPVLDLLQGGNLIDENVFTNGSIVQSPPGRYAPYDTYISAAAGWSLDPADTTPPAPVFSYSSATPAGAPVTSVHIPFAGTNDTRWTWNATSGKWLLSYSGTPATVAGGGQIATSNIVIQTVHVTYGPWLENDVGGYEVQSRMTGSGPVMVLRNGVAVSGTWSRASVSDPTTLTASDGSPIDLKPGQTWVEIVPSTVTVTTTPPGSSTATTP